MRAVAYNTIRDQVLALANTDSTNATAEMLAKIAAFIQRRGRQAFQFYFWAETMECEERTVETSVDRVFIPLDQTSQTPIGLVKGVFADDPLSDPGAQKVLWKLSGANIYLPSYGYTTAWVHFQVVPPADFTTSAVIPAILRDAIAHAAYADFLRPSAKTSEVPLEETGGYAFLVDEVRKQAAMQRQSGKWTQN